MDRSDKALLAAFLLTAGLGTWTRCLMHDDGAIIIAAGWLGNFWDLYAGQIPDRAAAVLAMHGPAWWARATFDLDSTTYVVLAHALYFAVPLVLWLILRAVESERLFSRLYLAVVLPMLYFPTELIFGVGIWMIWLAWVSSPGRTTAHVALVTLLLGAVMAFSHAVLALMGLLFVLVGIAMSIFDRRLPMRTLYSVALLSLAILAVHFAMELWVPPVNPTDGASHEANQLAYINPMWMLRTIAHFPMLAALWFLLLVPAGYLLRQQWRFLAGMTFVVAVFGLWFALAGTSLKTDTWARHTGVYVLALALALALPGSAAWLKRAERPLILFAAVAAVSAVSFNIDVWLFGRYIDRDLRPGIVDAATVAHPWPSTLPRPAALRIVFKYGAGKDYVRDVVMPSYDFSRIPLAFYSYFRSDRRSVLFHPLGGGADWRPYECHAVARALDHARDTEDRMFLELVARQYCA